jgi:ankyrin repeat protein
MFLFPVRCYPNTYDLQDNVVTDLELDDFYHELYGDISYSWMHPYTNTTYYSSNIRYLGDMKNLLRKDTYSQDIEKVHKYVTKYTDFISQPKNDFLTHHQFIEWERIGFFNENPHAMLGLSAYNITSPVMSLIMPLVFFIMPFLIVKFALKKDLTFDSYMDVVKKQLDQNPFGRSIMHIGSPDSTLEQKMYGFGMVCLYVMNIYNNALSCMKFYRNLYHISDFIIETNEYLEHSRDLLEHHIKHKPCNDIYRSQLDKLHKEITLLMEDVDYVEPFNLQFSSIISIGQRLSTYYKLYNSKEVRNLMEKLHSFHSFIFVVERIKEKLNHKTITFCNIHTSPESHSEFRKYKYPFLVLRKDKREIISNNVNLENNYLVTGPNASGKTTNIKAILMNQIISQQFGCGFFEKATIKPYDYLYSYINIPDTSDRFSLFQAESKRCLDIIHNIQKYSSKSHFCVFDELYSGTNPLEATMAARAFITYISSFNVRFILTTHYYKLCKNSKEFRNVKNYCMKTTKKSDGTLQYLYRFKKGVSKQLGGIEVLRNLNYPPEILLSLEV